MNRTERFAAWDAAGRLLALVAEGDPTREPLADADPSLAFRIPAGVFEGFETSDRRTIEAGALVSRALPLGLSAMNINPEFGGHGLAFVAGRIETMTLVDASSWTNPLTGQAYGPGVKAWSAEGHFNDDDQGLWTRDRVKDGSLRYISVDLAGVEAEIEVTEEDEDGWPTDWIERYTAGEITGFTVCNGSAFAGCYIELVNADGEAETEPPAPDEEAVAASGLSSQGINVLNDGPGCEPCTSGAPAAVTAAGGPLNPPASWFADPALTEPTALTITDDGRVFGHLATWGTCHIGFADKCVTPPHSASEYSAFHTGAVRTHEGTDLAVGHLTMGMGHADLRLPAGEAAAHYDNTDSRWADVRAGEDDFGIWVAGAVLSGLTDEQLRLARGASLSGDWRRVGTGLELVAALAVNVPGFPVPRAAAIAASGVPTALVAAGASAAPSGASERRTEPPARDSAIDRILLRGARDSAAARLPKPRTLAERRRAAQARLKNR